MKSDFLNAESLSAVAVAICVLLPIFIILEEFGFPISFITPVATLAAAFLGASTAFLLESRTRQKEKRDAQLNAANRVLYVLYERLNAIKLFQIDFVNPIRKHPAKMIAMEPCANYRAPESEFNTENLSFLLQTNHKGYKALMCELHVANEQFHETVNSIKFRSDLHLNQFQPLLEADGHKAGDPITEKDVLNAIGERRFDILNQATNVVIGNVDQFIERGNKLRGDLITAFSNIFSPEEIFAFELLEKPVNNPN
ncbi:hypothetical protein KA005_27060 [bacterium]|nr:hypothetical protein [bacterium]